MIQGMKKQHQVVSSAGNVHNSYLDANEVIYLSKIGNINSANFPFNIFTNIFEWYIRTLADEIYKLGFINSQKYYRIKMFWPSQYEKFVNPNNFASGENITSYLQQFDEFDLEDYFDVVIMCTVDNTIQNSKQLILKIYLNSFTFLVKENERNNFSNLHGFELFIERQEVIPCRQENDINILSELTNLLLRHYIFNSSIQFEKIQLTPQQILTRIIPILKEETLVLLYELYKDI